MFFLIFGNIKSLYIFNIISLIWGIVAELEVKDHEFMEPDHQSVAKYQGNVLIG